MWLASKEGTYGEHQRTGIGDAPAGGVKTKEYIGMRAPHQKGVTPFGPGSPVDINVRQAATYESVQHIVTRG